jgi:hypothetical protein
LKLAEIDIDRDPTARAFLELQVSTVLLRHVEWSRPDTMRVKVRSSASRVEQRRATA